MTTSAEPCYGLFVSTLNLEDVFKLPPVERLRIAAAIWDSVADQPDQVPLTTLQAQELDARYVDYLAHPQDGTPWATAKAHILQAR